MLRSICLVFVLCCCIGCFGPREDYVTRARAMRWHDILTVEVLAVYDLLEYHVDTEPHLSHLVEVRVIEGPAAMIGQELTLPYDDWATGTRSQPRMPPPTRGEVVTMMPANWVTAPRRRR